MTKRRVWNYKTISLEAKKYDSRSKFRNAAGGAYNKAKTESWLEQVCDHMKKVTNQPYDFEEVETVARNYKFRSEFKEKKSGYYQRARRQGWLDEVCKHMQTRTDGRLHCVYAILNKRLNQVYIGITRQNLYKRYRDHKRSKSTTNSRKIANLTDTEFLQISEYIYSGDDVRNFAEQYFVDLYKKKGWEILNSQKAIGGLGYSETIWTFENLKLESKKYKSRSEFASKSASAYTTALHHERRREIFEELPLLTKRWDLYAVTEVALDCKHRGEFKEKFPTAYQWATRNGVLENICSHMEATHVDWDLEKVNDVAKKFDDRTSFQQSYSGAYKWAERENVLDEVTSHMEVLIRRWSDKEIFAEAKKYKTRTEFIRNSGSAAQLARQRDIFEQVCAHMENGNQKPKKWTFEKLKVLALSFKTRSEFKNNFPGAYTQSRKTKILDEICAHMEQKQKSWDLESIRLEAKKYTSRSKFKDAAGGAYVRARKEGWLDNVCSHMK